MTLSAGSATRNPNLVSQALVQDEQARIRATLGRVAIFRDLPQSAIDDLARRVGVKRVPGGSAVFAQEEAGDALYVILSGRVKVVMVGESGREVTLAVLRPADIFGEMSLFDGKARSASVIALEPTAALSLSREDLVKHIAGNPQTAMKLLAEMSRRLRRADETIAELALCDVNERLVRRLIVLAREDGVDLPEGMLIRRRPTQQDLANMVGSCRETVSRTFNQLARRGLIVPRGRALVVTRRLFQMTEPQSKAA
jgi:CRP-like cAMP-binding protein